MTTRDHYENLLAVHYSWMSGESFADKVAEQRLLLEQFGKERGKMRLACLTISRLLAGGCRQIQALSSAGPTALPAWYGPT